MRDECYRGAEVMADLTFVDVTSERVCYAVSFCEGDCELCSRCSRLTGQKVVLEKGLVVLGALLRSGARELGQVSVINTSTWEVMHTPETPNIVGTPPR